VIATVVHVESERQGSRTGATAVYPRGLRPPALEVYPAAFAGDGAELTGVQVIEEFQTISGPIILAPVSELGTLYDAALSFAFERDEGLALGSGWPPIVVGFDDRPRHDVRAHRLAAAEAAALFREPAGAPRWGEAGAGRGATAFGGSGGIAYASRPAGAGSVEAFVLLAGGLASDLTLQPAAGRARSAENPEGSNVAVLVTDLEVGPRGLGRIAAAGLGGLERVGRSARTLALAVSVGARITPPDAASRRELARDDAPGAEAAAAEAVLAAGRSILDHR
jgi:L-aminopeptidase/D-esterase-like protein